MSFRAWLLFAVGNGLMWVKGASHAHACVFKNATAAGWGAAALQSPWGKRSVCERVHENQPDTRVQCSQFLPIMAVSNVSPISSPRVMGSPCVYAYVTFCVRRVGEWYNKAVAHVIFNSLSPWKPAHMLGAIHPAECVCVCVCLWRCSSSSCFIWGKHTHVAHACRSVCVTVWVSYEVGSNHKITSD